MAKTRTIYLYSSATYIEKGWYKNGQTKLDAKTRVKQQDTTSNPEPLILIRSWEVPAKITDKKIHAALKESKYIKTRVDADREWFMLKTDKPEEACDIIQQHINKLQHGVDRPDSYEMRIEQADCHDKMVAAEKTHKKFLIDGKMRFGKCFTVANVLTTLKCRRVLILTGKPSVEREWRNTFKRHVKFTKWNFWSAKDFAKGEPYRLPDTGCHVLFASLQDADLQKDKWKIAKKYHYVKIVLDEQHYHVNTDRTRKLLDELSYDGIYELSGTPFQALLSGEYHDENTYKWGYIDEQRRKREHSHLPDDQNLYRWLPRMDWHTIQVCGAAVASSLAYTKEEGFTLVKMFAAKNRKFNDEGSVKLHFDDMFGVGVHKTRSPIRSCGAPNHILMNMPSSVSSCEAAEDLINKNSAAYGGYYVINASGNNVTDIDDVLDAIQRYPKTITITCGRFNTGTTVPEWDMVIMLDGGEAATSYYQTIFRGQSSDPMRRKEKCDVVDYNPQRAVQAIYEYCAYMTPKGKNVQDTLREYLDFAPLLDHAGNMIIQKDVNFVLDLIADTGGYIEQFGKSCMFNWDALKDRLDQAILLSNLDGETGVTVKKQINDNEIPKGKNFANFIRGEAKDKKEKDALRKLRENAITLMKKLPNYIYVDRKQPVESYEDIVRLNHNDIFRDATGISIKDFSGLVESSFIEKDHLNRCIMAFRQSLVS